MLATKRIALTQALLKMEQPAEVVLYAIDLVMEAGSFAYAFSTHTDALYLITQARKIIKQKGEE